MSKLEFVDKIRKEEKKKVMPIILTTIFIVIILALTYFVFRVPYAIKQLTWVVLLLIIIFLLIAWYRAYYK
jgi:hypothetical protein